MIILDENAPFGEWAEMWAKKKTVGMKYSYRRNNRGYLNHLNPIYEIPIREVKTMHIEAIVVELAECNPHTHRPSSKKLLKNIRSTAMSIIEYAINNCDNLYKNKAVAVEIPTNAPKTERTALSVNEQHLVFTTSHRAKISAMIMLLCGLRVGEMIALTWDNIDLEKGTIYVCQSAYNVNSNRMEIQHKTKNGKTRNVSIPRRLIEMLKQEKKISKSRFVTTKANGMDMHSRGSWYKMWQSYIDTLGIYFTAHQLRHTYASMLYAAGVDVKSASELLGHSDIEITMRIYTHLTEKGKKISVEKYDMFLEQTFPDTLW